MSQSLTPAIAARPATPLETVDSPIRVESALGRAPLRAPGLRLAVISGLGYRNQRGGLGKVSRFLKAFPEIPHRIARVPAEVDDALEEYERLGIDLLAVSGGDGTVSMTLSALLQRPIGSWMPLIGVLAGGRTNMTAGDVGLTGNQVRKLESLLAWADMGGSTEALIERPVLRIDGALDNDSLYGFFVGAAAVYWGTLRARSVHAKSRLGAMRTGLGTAVSVTKLVAAHLAGRNPLPRSRLHVTLDGEELSEVDYCLFFATTLDRMALGLRPFWDRTPAPLHITAIAHEHRHLLRAAANGLRGKPSRLLTAANGFLSRNVHTIDLRVEDGATLDGEFLRTGLEVPLRLSAERTMRFVRL